MEEGNAVQLHYIISSGNFRSLTEGFCLVISIVEHVLLNVI